MAGARSAVVPIAARGARVSRDWLLSLLERAGSAHAWGAFTYLGRPEAEIASGLPHARSDLA